VSESLVQKWIDEGGVIGGENIPKGSHHRRSKK